MDKKIIKTDEFKDYIHETRGGIQLSLKDWLETLEFSLFSIGFAIGFLIFIAISFFEPIGVSSVANQMCGDGHLISYQWDMFHSNFATLICKTPYGTLINLVK